jgi:hypothetical protein
MATQAAHGVGGRGPVAVSVMRRLLALAGSGGLGDQPRQRGDHEGPVRVVHPLSAVGVAGRIVRDVQRLWHGGASLLWQGQRPCPLER